MRRLLAWQSSLHGPTPPYMQRWLQRWNGLLLLGIVALVTLNVILYSFVIKPSTRDTTFLFTLLGACFVILAAGMIWRVHHKRGLLRRAEAAGYSLCGECAYDVSTLSSHKKTESVTCPECGATVHLPEVRRTWHACLMRSW